MCWFRALRTRTERSGLLGVIGIVVDRLELKQGDREDQNLV